MSQRSSTREKKLSQRASDAQEAGEAVPGISPPGRATPPYNSTYPQATPLQFMLMEMNRPARPLPSTAEDYGLGPDKFIISLDWRAHDVDVGQDEWNDFDSSLDNRGIASAFMQRAKRAFWAGKAWKEFEQEERTIIPVSLNAKGEQINDPHVLDNGRRVEIFEAIKVRLCEEIWTGNCEADSSTQAGSSTSHARHDTPGAVIEECKPTEDERAEGIVKHTRNSEGYWEPRYDHEGVIKAPGILRGIQANREEMPSSKPDLVSDMDDSD